MRLFIAIKLNDEVKAHLMKAVGELKKYASSGNFTRRDNLHLTLVFLGELEEEKTEVIKTILDRIQGQPFQLRLSGFGKFKKHGGDIHWAGIEKNQMLFRIQKQLESELHSAGFILEDRPFSPHLTLGRGVRLPDPSADLYGTLSGRKPEMTADRISLMKSERIDGILTYTEIFGKDL